MRLVSRIAPAIRLINVQRPRGIIERILLSQNEHVTSPSDKLIRHMSIRIFHSFLALLLLSGSLSAAPLQVVRDLSALGEQARERGVAILLMVSQEHCGYCVRLKEEVLQPMEISGDYVDKVLIRELLIDPWEDAIDFDGERKKSALISDRYRVWVTPTLLYLGPDGRELTPRMLGVQTIEMYGYYVDEAIGKALRQLREPEAPAYRPTPKDLGVEAEVIDAL